MHFLIQTIYSRRKLRVSPEISSHQELEFLFIATKQVLTISKDAVIYDRLAYNDLVTIVPRVFQDWLVDVKPCIFLGIFYHMPYSLSAHAQITKNLACLTCIDKISISYAKLLYRGNHFPRRMHLLFLLFPTKLLLKAAFLQTSKKWVLCQIWNKCHVFPKCDEYAQML